MATQIQRLIALENQAAKLQADNDMMAEKLDTAEAAMLNQAQRIAALEDSQTKLQAQIILTEKRLSDLISELFIEPAPVYGKAIRAKKK